MFSCGGAALVEIVTLSGNGKKWNVLNGSNGSSLMDLPTFPFHSSSVGNFMSAFLDAESGDMYVFHDGMWNPFLNIGLHRIGRKGKALSPRLRTAPLSFSADDHLKNTNNEVEAISADLDNKLYIDSRFIKHWAFKGVGEVARAFISTSLGEWVINSEWSVKTPQPHSMSPVVIATSKDSPVLIQLGNKLIMASEINDGKVWSNLEKIVRNFIRHSVLLIISTQFEVQRQTMGSLFHTVFCGGYDMLSSQVRCPALAKLPIYSALSHGPEKIDMPGLGLGFTDEVKPFLGTNVGSLQSSFQDSPNKTSTGTSYSPRTVQNPSNFTKTRLANIITANGQGINASLEIINSTDTAPHDNIAHVMSPIRPSERKPSTMSTRKVVNLDNSMTEEVHGSDSGALHAEQIMAFNDTGGFDTSSLETEVAPSTATFLPGWTEMMKQKTLPFGIETSFDMQCTKAFIPHHSPRSLTQTRLDKTQRTYMTSPRDTAPYNTYKKFLKRKAKASTAKPSQYQGQYTEVFLSPREKRIKEEFHRKKTVFVGEKNFITSFGKSMALPLREEGQIRAFSKYEDDHISMAGIKMIDRPGLRVDEKEKHIAGHWKK